MIRLMLLALVGATLLSCSNDVREDGDPTPQQLRDEVAAVGRDVVPALSSALRVPAPDVPMIFTERGGFGLYDFRGSGQFQGVPGRREQLVASLERAVESGGMRIAEASRLEDVRATRGNVMVRLTVRPGPDDASSAVEMHIGSIQPISADEDEVDTTPTGLNDLIEQ